MILQTAFMMTTPKITLATSITTRTMGYVKMFLFILIGYLLVMVLDFRRIKRIPMDQALKNVE